MNRKKKINEILKKKQKKANAKLHKSNKPKYISKAERAKLEAEQAEAVQAETEQTETASPEAGAHEADAQ
ncbi:DUF2986 domain-containing protein [Vibrio mexicanus]|uniref:DUF2986 domain-containing protein n=1 Tax=Vibrio mexicanus TaxID=1004326 RepID=UPI00063C0C14|nr:DUF2986 domain-containing protein [Vibrio mexicanus]